MPFPGWKYLGGPPWVRAKLGTALSHCFLFVSFVGGLCRCRSRDGSTRGDPPGYARLNVVKASPRDGKFPPITPTGGCKSSRGRNLETVFSGWCDSGFDPGIYGFNWFIIVLNSRCESVESGGLSSSRIRIAVSVFVGCILYPLRNDST